MDDSGLHEISLGKGKRMPLLRPVQKVRFLFPNPFNQGASMESPQLFLFGVLMTPNCPNVFSIKSPYREELIFDRALTYSESQDET